MKWNVDKFSSGLGLRIAGVLLAAALFTTIATLASAQTASGSAGDSTTVAAYQVEGFRSAHFGMNEDDVRSAIKDDFRVSAADIKKSIQPVEQTTALTISAKNIVDGSGGAAQISYIFGYKSKALIQVNVLWTGTGASNQERMDRVTALLRNYFMQRSFQKNNLVVDATLPDGSVLVFGGTDPQGRQVQLLVHRETVAGGQGVPSPAIVRLSYIASPAKPDVYAIPDGQF